MAPRDRRCHHATVSQCVTETLPIPAVVVSFVGTVGLARGTHPHPAVPRAAVPCVFARDAAPCAPPALGLNVPLLDSNFVLRQRRPRHKHAPHGHVVSGTDVAERAPDQQHRQKMDSCQRLRTQKPERCRTGGGCSGPSPQMLLLSEKLEVSMDFSLAIERQWPAPSGSTPGTLTVH